MTIISQRFDNLGLEDPSKTYHLGIMGGTFDPIHIGHLACAEQVRESFDLSAVIFVPAGNPAYKQEIEVTPAKQRLEMCQLAVFSNPYFDVSALEVEREGITYTVDTLRQIRAHYPKNVKLYFITGADAVFNIIKWRDSAAIGDLARLIAVTRPGYIVSDEHKRDIAENSNYQISYAQVTALAISSSDLRCRVQTGLSIRYLTMQSVMTYILDNRLYENYGCMTV